MPTDLENALSALEDATEGVLGFVKGASYGLRVAAKRVGDITSSSPPLAEARPRSAAEMERLVRALETGEDQLSDLAVLALGDHFCAFLARALELPRVPPLPRSTGEVEELAGTPGALAGAPFWFPLLLELYKAVLSGRRLDRASLERLGLRELELVYTGGKVKLFRAGDHVTLNEQQLGETAQAILAVAKAIRLRLLTA